MLWGLSRDRPEKFDGIVFTHFRVVEIIFIGKRLFFESIPLGAGPKLILGAGPDPGPPPKSFLQKQMDEDI